MIDFLDKEETIESDRLKLASDAIYMKSLMN
jgi:hypothetical protein